MALPESKPRLPHATAERGSPAPRLRAHAQARAARGRGCWRRAPLLRVPSVAVGGSGEARRPTSPSQPESESHFPGEPQPHHPPGPRPFSPTSARDTFWNQPGRPPPFAVMGFLQEAQGRSDCGSNRVCSRRTLRPTPRHHLRGRSGLPQAGLRGRGSRGLGAGGPGALGPEVQEGDFCKSLRDRWGGLCARVSV